MPRTGPKKMRYNNPNIGKNPGLSKDEREEILEHFAKGDCPARHFRQFILAIDELDQANRRLRQEVRDLRFSATKTDILRDAIEIAVSTLERCRPERDVEGEPRIRSERDIDVEVAYLRLTYARSVSWPFLSPQMPLPTPRRRIVDLTFPARITVETGE